MILVRLEIENYKQFAGTHVIDFPEQGAVAVIGHNGAGKTTLFEAIEWCLYGALHGAKLDDIRPRQATGKAIPRVTLIVQMQDGQLYRIERQLRNTVRATIHKLTPDGEIDELLVDGGPAVSKYVANKLVGLSQDAFNSTFFTRQKELSFFGSIKDTERRREVSRLLGMETIRKAQELIAEERRDAEKSAGIYRAEYMSLSEGHDFPTEIAHAKVAISEAELELRRAEQLEALRQRELEQAQQREDQIRALQAQDHELRQRIGQVDAEIREVQAHQRNAVAQIERLAQREADLASLQPLADREVALQATVDRWDRERAKAEQARQLTQQITQLDRERARTAETVRQIALAPRAIAVPGWTWTEADDRQPARAAQRLADVARRLDVAEARRYAEGTAQARHAYEQQQAAQEHLEKCERHMRRLANDLQKLLAPGEPRDLMAKADAERTAALAEAADASARAQAALVEAAKLEKAIHELHDSGDAECPTCHQPIDATVLWAIENGIREKRNEAKRHEQIAEVAHRRAAAAEAASKQAQERQQERVTLEERMRNGQAQIDETTIKRDVAQRMVAEALASLGLDTVPSEDTVRHTAVRYETLREIAAQADRLSDLASALRQRDEDIERHRAMLAQLGQVHYDPDAHQRALQELKQAQNAAGQIAQIRQELTQRPDLEATVAATTERIAALQRQRATLERQREAVGYDEAEDKAVTAARRAAQDAVHAARDAKHQADIRCREAKRALADLEAMQRNVADKEERARLKEREEDQLKAMYEGFNDFEKWVAQQINPHLADRTGEMLAEITEGRYDRVRFDDNFGLQVYDGDQAFPVTHFSGGERDVAALSARLALAKIIGAQAHHPPAFIVLDEVFGSLDQERRINLLGTLNALTANELEGFRQLFVISHVDDIRQSQAFDQVWRIREDSSGVSRWENMQLSGGTEDV